MSSGTINPRDLSFYSMMTSTRICMYAYSVQRVEILLKEQKAYYMAIMFSNGLQLYLHNSRVATSDVSVNEIGCGR